MPTRTLPARMKAARASDVRPHHLPVIPDWWPLQPSDPTVARLTDAERTTQRRTQALVEATAGPVDGKRYAVALVDGRPPEAFHPAGEPGLRYVLDRAESTRDGLVYRYDMDSPLHALLMAAVTDGYREAGPDYTLDAREDTVHEDDRHAPPADAFAYHSAPLEYPRG